MFASHVPTCGTSGASDASVPPADASLPSPVGAPLLDPEEPLLDPDAPLLEPLVGAVASGALSSAASENVSFVPCPCAAQAERTDADVANARDATRIERRREREDRTVMTRAADLPRRTRRCKWITGDPPAVSRSYVPRGSSEG